MNPDDIAREVDAAFDEAKGYMPTIGLTDRLEKCRELAKLALTHPCTEQKATRIWEGK